MKYTRLTKEQFAELEAEFINFLATQSITGSEWARIKEEQPETAEQELDLFSDLIWEGVLNNVEYLENCSPEQLFLFKLDQSKMYLIVVKVSNPTRDISTEEGLNWLQQNIKLDEIEFFTASNDYSGDRSSDIFNLIRKGAVITNGTLYSIFKEIVSN